MYWKLSPRNIFAQFCSKHTQRIYDYQIQTIKDFSFQLKHCFLVLKKRRYVCSCGKRFYKNYCFLPRYFHRTQRLTEFIADALHDIRSITSFAKICNVSTVTVNRILDTISFGKPKIPQILSIDAFKGTADGQKYLCILVVPVKHSVLDILPSSSQAHLVSYFKDIPKSERYRLKFFVCDIWELHTELAQPFFPNASIVIDKYHFIRQVTWAIENICKRIQKNMPASLRKYYKRSRSLILTTLQQT